ncbi:hypothetical protein MLD38_012320 [Melastoma candidum]|uniref:Uncharacterized protein n=1 Tax=Melastoma candidum TaxID=119954 RepID=A0ACB9R5Y4_9MYRT|nr:hypothetical protein MLD38_012320 [Melastoma candidum]
MVTVRPSKPSKGRKKIEIKKIDNKSSQQVTFSKRRAGLFKKASELCILCGAQVAIIVFSPVHKVFSFGHPNADAIIERYLMGGQLDEDLMVGEFEEALPIQALNQQYDEVMKELGEEKRRARNWSASGIGMGQGILWWEDVLRGDMAEDELEQYISALESLVGRVAMKAESIMMKSLLKPLVDNEHRIGAGVVDGFEIARFLD